eukprot:2292769-Pleurochrysis_carterae.AAC.2
MKERPVDAWPRVLGRFGYIRRKVSGGAWQRGGKCERLRETRLCATRARRRYGTRRRRRRNR